MFEEHGANLSRGNRVLEKQGANRWKRVSVFENRERAGI